MSEQKAKEKHYTQHLSIKNRTPCEGIWYQNDSDTLSKPRGCLLNHCDSRILMRDCRTAGGGLGTHTRIQPTQTLESVFCQFMILAVFPNSINVYSDVFASPGRKNYGIDPKEKCDLAFTLKTCNRQIDQFVNSTLQVSMNLHGNYWHRIKWDEMQKLLKYSDDMKSKLEKETIRLARHIYRGTNLSQKITNKSKSKNSNINICHWYCPKIHSKPWKHFNEIFVQQILNSIFISCSSQRTFYKSNYLRMAEFEEEEIGCEDIEKEFWPRINNRINIVKHAQEDKGKVNT